MKDQYTTALMTIAESINKTCGDHDLTLGQVIAALTTIRMNAIMQLPDPMDARAILQAAHKMEKALFDPTEYNLASFWSGRRAEA